MSKENPAMGWPVKGIAVRLVLVLSLVASIFISAQHALILWRQHKIYNLDFFAFWSFAHFARHYSLALLYRPDILGAYQHIIAPGFILYYPYIYPPDFLLFLWPLGGLSYSAGLFLWSGLSAVFFVVAVWAMLLNNNWRLFGVAFALLAPASLLNATIGESGFFYGALLVGGFYNLPKRPVFAGILFGLLTLKPQLGILVPVALLALGAWPAIFAAMITAFFMVAISCLTFPAYLWPAWLHSLQNYQNLMVVNHDLDSIMTTMEELALPLHLPLTFFVIVQILVVAAIAAACFAAFRQAPYRLAVATLLVGTFIASPHAYVYDSPIIAVAILLLAEFIDSKTGYFTTLQFVAVTIVFLMPIYASPQHLYFIFSSLVYLLFFIILMRLNLGIKKPIPLD